MFGKALHSSVGYLAKIVPVAVICQLNLNKESQCARFSAATYPANDPTEDRHVMKNTPSWGVAAVFDGHGGWQVSEHASKILVDKALANLELVNESDEILIDEKLTEAFDFMEKEVVSKVRPAFNMGFGEVAKVGSCVLLAFKKADRLVVANCGDCRAVLGTATSTAPSSSGALQSSNSSLLGIFAPKASPTRASVRFVSTRINRDHNARVALEQLRLEQDHVGEGGLFRCKNPHACYVKGRLQLTRSLGDEYLKDAEFNGSKDRHKSG